jgi:putative oxidoreductase
MLLSLGSFAGLALLFMRLMVALIFADSGRRDLKDPSLRAKDTGTSRGFTIFLGVAEIAGGFGIAFGVLTQLAAIGLTLIMLGALQKKLFVWHTGFWGKNGLGWYYELTLVSMNLVIMTTGGGPYVLWR